MSYFQALWSVTLDGQTHRFEFQCGDYYDHWRGHTITSRIIADARDNKDGIRDQLIENLPKMVADGKFALIPMLAEAIHPGRFRDTGCNVTVVGPGELRFEEVE